MSPMAERVIGCGDNGFRCSCADCPTAQGCAQPPPPPPAPPATCRVGALPCLAFALLWVYLGLAGLILWAFVRGPLGRRGTGAAEAGGWGDAAGEGEEGETLLGAGGGGGGREGTQGWWARLLGGGSGGEDGGAARVPLLGGELWVLEAGGVVRHMSGGEEDQGERANGSC